MKSLFLVAFLFSSLSFGADQSAFKAEKMNQKTNISVEQDDQAIVIPICNGCTASMIKACEAYTSSYSNEALCLQVQSNPEVTYGCYKGTSSYESEAACIRGQVNPQIMAACKSYTSTYTNERICLSYGVSPSSAEACYRNTSTAYTEQACLVSCGRSERKELRSRRN